MDSESRDTRTRKFGGGRLWGVVVGVVLLGALLSIGLVSDQSPGSGEDRADPLFTRSLVIRGPGSYLQVSHHPALLPEPGRDFLLAIWVKVRALPSTGDRHIVLLKYEGEHRARPGYGLAFSHTENGLRPEVYWKNSEGKGGWYPFPEVTMDSDRWYLLALSFRDSRFLGLHLGSTPYVDKPRDQQDPLPTELHVLGGYDVADIGSPFNRAPLIIGAPTHSTFKGRIGPLAIFTARNLTDVLAPTLQELAAEPDTALASPGEHLSRQLLIRDGIADQGPHQLPLVRVGLPGTRQRAHS